MQACSLSHCYPTALSDVSLLAFNSTVEAVDDLYKKHTDMLAFQARLPCFAGRDLVIICEVEPYYTPAPKKKPSTLRLPPMSTALPSKTPWHGLSWGRSVTGKETQACNRDS